MPVNSGFAKGLLSLDPAQLDVHERSWKIYLRVREIMNYLCVNDASASKIVLRSSKLESLKIKIVALFFFLR